MRYALINREQLIVCCGIETDKQLRRSHWQWVEKSIQNGINVRQPRWTESIAVGSKGFVQGVLQKLELRAKGRRVRKGVDHYELRELGAIYDTDFTLEISLLRVGNEFYWGQLCKQSIG